MDKSNPAHQMSLCRTCPCMKRIPSRWLIFSLFFLLALIYLIYLAWMNYHGYCFEQKKYLSQQELQRSVIAALLKHYPPAVERSPIAGGWSQSVPARFVPYQDVEHFLSSNPNCCSVSQTRKELEGSGATLMEKLTGTVVSFVDLNYTVRYWDKQNIFQESQIKSFQAVSNCGKPTRKWYPGEYFFEFHPSNF